MKEISVCLMFTPDLLRLIATFFDSFVQKYGYFFQDRQNLFFHGLNHPLERKPAIPVMNTLIIRRR